MLERSDFTLEEGSDSVFYYLFKGRKIGWHNNWPFHKTIAERDEFLKNLGFETDYGIFPYTTTKEEALILLVVLINDYNARQ